VPHADWCAWTRPASGRPPRDALARRGQLTDLALAWGQSADAFERRAPGTHPGRDELPARTLCQHERSAGVGVGQRRTQRLTRLDSPAHPGERAAGLQAQAGGLEHRTVVVEQFECVPAQRQACLVVGLCHGSCVQRASDRDRRAELSRQPDLGIRQRGRFAAPPQVGKRECRD
jgi:hypothetical protein